MRYAEDVCEVCDKRIKGGETMVRAGAGWAHPLCIAVDPPTPADRTGYCATLDGPFETPPYEPQSSREQAEALVEKLRRSWNAADGFQDQVAIALAAIEQAEQRGRQQRYEYQVYGTDACPHCDHGRVTLYFRVNMCVECEHKKGTP